VSIVKQNLYEQTNKSAVEYPNKHKDIKQTQKTKKQP